MCVFVNAGHWHPVSRMPNQSGTDKTDADAGSVRLDDDFGNQNSKNQISEIRFTPLANLRNDAKIIF